MKKIVLSILIAIVIITFKQDTILAQGAYVCNWDSNAGTNGACIPSGSCDEGYSLPLTDIAKCTSSKGPNCPNGEFVCKKTTKEEDISGQNFNPNSMTLDTIEDQALPGFRFRLSGGNIGNVIQAALPWIFGISGLLLLLYLIYGGIHLMTSGGDPKVVAEAKGKITNALIGFVIIFTAFWIVQLVGRVFGLTPIVNIFG